MGKKNWLLLIILVLVFRKPIISLIKANPKVTGMLGSATMPTIIDKAKSILRELLGEEPQKEQEAK